MVTQSLTLNLLLQYFGRFLNSYIKIGLRFMALNKILTLNSYVISMVWEATIKRTLV